MVFHESGADRRMHDVPIWMCAASWHVVYTWKRVYPEYMSILESNAVCLEHHGETLLRVEEKGAVDAVQ